jgi:carbonic anhydrase
MLTAYEALQRLREGNDRFVAGVGRRGSVADRARLRELAAGQQPFAVVLGCSDSRVPAEIVFDQGLGDLFVIRVAGNIVAPSQVGSIEFAAARFGTRLVVVLGHTQCGAVLATLEELRRPAARQSPNLRCIVDRVRPAVEPLLATELRDDPEALVRCAVRANIRAAAEHLRHSSAIVRRLIETEGVVVVGAEYALETGIVDFFDGVPAPAPRAAPPREPAAGHDPRLATATGIWTVEARGVALSRAPDFGRRFFARLFERFPDLQQAVGFLRWSEQPRDVYAVFDPVRRGPGVGFSVQVDPDLEYLIVWSAEERAEFGDWDGDQAASALAFVAELPARVTVENVNHPGRTHTVDGRKYRAVRDALLAALPAGAPGLTQSEMVEGVARLLPQNLFPGGEKAGWWSKTVQLDLEAKGVIVREPSRPLRWHRV